MVPTILLPVGLVGAGYVALVGSDEAAGDVLGLAAVPTAGWLYFVSNNDGANVVAYAILMVWAYDAIVSDDDGEINPIAVVGAAAASFALVEGMD